MKEIFTPAYTCQAILDKVDQKLPFSLVRYGDGEAMVLHGVKQEEKFDYVLNRQLGYLPSAWDKANIRANLVKAYRECDMIGIPVNNRFMSDQDSFWARAADIISESIGADIFKQRNLTSIDIHSFMLQEGFFEDLLFRRQRLCYISCRNLDEQLKDKYRIPEVHSFIIAPEAKFSSGYHGDPHYPYQFEQIKYWISTLPLEGTVCLVGAGVVGKIYNNWFRDLGGISIDIGSVFDSWAGKVTRGPGRGIDAEDLTFKL